MDPALIGQNSYHDASFGISPYDVLNQNVDLDDILDNNTPQYQYSAGDWNVSHVQASMAYLDSNNYQVNQGYPGFGPAISAGLNYQSEYGYSGAGTAGAPILNHQNKQPQSEDPAQSSNSIRRQSSSERSDPTPKKRRKSRKTKKTLSDAEQDVKRDKFLERNRYAASKCREKKKRYTENLQDRHDRSKDENDRLYNTVAELKFQVGELKSRLHEHVGCNDPGINDWIQGEAHRFVYAPYTPPQPPRMNRTESLQSLNAEYGMDKNIPRSSCQSTNQESESSAMSRQSSSQSQRAEGMSCQESTRTRRGTMPLQKYSQSSSAENTPSQCSAPPRRSVTNTCPQNSGASNVKSPVDSGISNMGSPEKIKGESPPHDEGFSGTPMMQNQRLPVGLVGGLQGMVDPEEFLMRNVMQMAHPQYPHPI